MKKKLFIPLFILLTPFIVVAFPKGDVSGNDKVDSSDYVLVRKHILKQTTLTGDKLTRADMNGDGKITSMDYIAIRKIIINGNSVTPTPIVTETPTITPSPTPQVTITPTPKPTPTITPTYNLDNFPYHYHDATADLTIEKKIYNSPVTGKRTVYYQSHLVLSDYTRLHTALTSYTRSSDGTYQTRKVSTAANGVGAILALEGDYRLRSNYGTVRGGVFYSEKSLDPSTIKAKKGCYAYYNSATGVLDDCNNLKSKTIADAINSKELTDTFRFATNLLVNGINQSKIDANGAHRQANFVGYVKPGEFYFIVSEGAAYSDSNKPSDGSSYGLTPYDRGEILKSLGCSFGAQFDGGQSVIVWFKGKILQSKYEIKNERDWLTDFVYFK